MQLGKYYQLGYYRPSQAYDRSVVRGRTSLRRSADLRGIGDDVTDSPDSQPLIAPVTINPWLLLGIGAVGFWLTGIKTGPIIKKKRVARLKRKLRALET